MWRSEKQQRRGKAKYKNNKELRRSRIFQACEGDLSNLRVGDWWALGSVCHITCSFIVLCAAAQALFFVSVFALHELLGPFVT